MHSGGSLFESIMNFPKSLILEGVKNVDSAVKKAYQYVLKIWQKILWIREQRNLIKNWNKWRSSNNANKQWDKDILKVRRSLEKQINFIERNYQKN